MDVAPRTPTDAELVELHDRLWNDPRRRDDRSAFFECEACGRAVRWIANLGSATGSSIQVVARPVATAATFDRDAHAGLVAVWPDRSGFTVSRVDEYHELEGALLYRCHWDVCADARRLRDRIARERGGSRHGAGDGPRDRPELAPELLRRYVAWRDGRDR
jgi:hypothetical protein